MPTKREYLVQKGLAKEGRGRLSAAAHQAIRDAINSGVKFDEPDNGPKKTVTVKSKDENGRTVVTTRRVDDVPVVMDARADRPDGFYTFSNPDATTFKRLHSNACARCSLSFQWCRCPDGPVQFVYPYVSVPAGVYAVLVGVPDGREKVTAPPPRRSRKR